MSTSSRESQLVAKAGEKIDHINPRRYVYTVKQNPDFTPTCLE
jgi:hypothetical protein